MTEIEIEAIRWAVAGLLQGAAEFRQKAGSDEKWAADVKSDVTRQGFLESAARFAAYARGLEAGAAALAKEAT